MTRRALIGGGVGVAGLALAAVAAGESVEHGLLPGRSTMYRVLDLDGPAGHIPDVAPGPMVSGSFVSAERLGARCGWAVSYPPGSRPGDALPVLVVLHGYSDTHADAFTGLGLDRFLAAAVRGGAAPFAIAAVDGGNSYWHRRASGEDAGAMVSDEFVPLLHDRGLDTARIGLLGWSMGGYGALHLAEQLGPGRVAAVVAESPAIWHDFAETAHGAFDDVADYARNTLFGRQCELAGIPVMIDCGTGDGFYPAVRDYVAGFPRRPAGGFQRGGHDDAYWRRVTPGQLVFVARRGAAA